MSATASQRPVERSRFGARQPVACKRSPLASGSVRVHLLRGAVGLIAAVLGIVLAAVVGPAALLLLGVTVVAWRGCPTCWTVGLIGTLADQRSSRDS